MIAQIHPGHFNEWLDEAQTPAGGSGERLLPLVLDVREPWEIQTASVQPDGFELLHIPMRDIPVRLADLQNRFDANHPIACLCHHGMRSMQVASYLSQAGFTEVINLQGGIDAWSRQLDAKVPVY